MYSDAAPFIDLCLAGKVQPDDIDDFVAAWHDGASSKDIWDFLGMSRDEYGRWMQNPTTLTDILDERRSGFSSQRPI